MFVVTNLIVMNPLTFTEEIKQLALQVPLFCDLPSNVKQTLWEKLDCVVYEVAKNETVLRQNTPCKSLFVLLKGRLQVDIIDVQGNEVLVEYIIASRAFATPHLFNKDNTLPATFTAKEDCLLLVATKESVFQLISEEPYLLRSFLSVTGNCNRCTTTRLRVLSYKSLRSRFVSYLLEQRVSDDGSIHIEHNQGQLADYLCVTRPALSREINKMVKEGLIKVNGRIIDVQDRSVLTRYLL